MFTLAQYVFGLRRSTENNINYQQHQPITPPTQVSCFENDDSYNICSLTNIENDWILIDVKDQSNKTSEKPNQLDPKRKLSNAASIKKINKTAKNINLEQDEAQLVDRFARFETKKRHDKTSTGTSMDNISAENASMNVFDNLFIKKPLVPLSKTEQKKLILTKIQNSAKKNNDNNGNNKENMSMHRSKKKSNHRNGAEINHIINNVPFTLNGNNSNSNKNAFTAIVGKDKSCRKQNITKKQHQRQNKVSIQRNGPIIRQKKMFIHLNGIYNNRKNC